MSAPNRFSSHSRTRLRFIAVSLLSISAMMLGQTMPAISEADETADESAAGLAQEQAAVDFAEMALATLVLVNEQRKKVDMPPLEIDGLMTRLAQEHSDAMAKGDRKLEHEDFLARRTEIFEKLALNHAAENVTRNRELPEHAAAQAFEKWMTSDEHRKNMLGKYSRAGVGVARSAAGQFYFTLLLAGPWPWPGD